MKRVTVAVLLSGLIALFTLGFSGCGGSSQSLVGVTSSVSDDAIDQGQTVTITASFANGAAGAGVTWSVTGGGTLSGQTATSAVYNAPASVATAFTATVTATSTADKTTSASLQIRVSPPPAIKTTSITATAGIVYSARLNVAGGTSPYVWSISAGTLPAGLTLNRLGVISGTPTVAGSSSVTFKVLDSAEMSASQVVTITVNPPPPVSITTTSLAVGTIGTVYSQTLQATGGIPPYTWSVTAGTLPAGLTLSSAGVISGTPTGTTTSTSNFTVTATDSETPAVAASANLSIVVVEPPLSVTTSSLAGGSIGTPYSQTLQAIGGTPPYTWSIISGAPPAGLSLSSPSTGLISGTPTATGTTNFTVRVTDSATPTLGVAMKALSITINTDLAITTTSLPGGSLGTAYSATLAASGGASPYTWSISGGTLPAGFSINASSGAISGTPAATGTSAFTVKVTDSESPAVSTTANLSITIATASCPNNPNLNGHYAMLLHGWSSATTVTAAVGSFVADSAGNILSGTLDVNDQGTGPGTGTFTGTYCVSSNNLATINLTYGGSLTGTNTFEAALSSIGSNGAANGEIIFYDNSGRKASGLLRQQNTAAFSTSKIDGNYAFGLVGADGGGGGTPPRYAVAGQFTANGTANLSGFYDSDLYGPGAISGQTLSSSDLKVLPATGTGRGTVTIAFNGSNAENSTLSFVFYVVSASELLVMEDDAIGYSLLTGRMLQQSGTFTDASLNGVSVIETQTLTLGSAPSATVGLVTTDSTGATISITEDESVAGSLTSPSEAGTYNLSNYGRVTLTIPGQATPPVFYLIGPNQAFVVGTNSLTVDYGVLEPQSGSSFTAASLSGNYHGGSLQPVDVYVSPEVNSLQANGSGGTFTGTSEQNGIGGPLKNSVTETYAFSLTGPSGRAVVSQGSTEVGIIYMISDTQFVLLPANSDYPTLVQFAQ